MHWPHMPNPDMWKEYQLLQLLPVPPPAPLDGIGHTCQTQTCGESILPVPPPAPLDGIG